MISKYTCPRYLKIVLIVAGVYNIVWGLSVIFFPEWFFNFFNMDSPRYPEIWQCVGMIVGVYGLGYILAARDPYAHWIIVLVGFLGKIFGPIGFVYAISQNVFPIGSFITIITNDIIWWVPFGMILYGALRSWASVPSHHLPKEELSHVLGKFSADGKTLLEHNFNKPQMIVFLRHFGCVFCQQSIHELKKVYPAVRESGLGLMIVHSSSEENASQHLEALNMTYTHVVSDPNCLLYRAFDLEKGTFNQLFGWQFFKNGIIAFLQGYDAGKLQGDGFQLPGAFIIFKNKIVNSYRSNYASDSPDFEQLLENANLPDVVKISS